MATEPTHNLLDEVQKYLASASREQIIEDMQASDFEAYSGVGNCVFADATMMHVEISAATLYTSNFVRTDMIMSVPMQPVKLFATLSPVYTITAPAGGAAPTHEEMPLAA